MNGFHDIIVMSLVMILIFPRKPENHRLVNTLVIHVANQIYNNHHPCITARICFFSGSQFEADLSQLANPPHTPCAGGQNEAAAQS